MKKQILVVEDDPEIARSIMDAAKELSMEVDHVSDGEAGLQRALAGSFSLVVLDLGLPNLNGFEVCRALRAQKPNIAILIISSRSLEIDKVLGLELGADDYVVKPFSMREVIARMNALLRRTERAPEIQARIVIKELDIDVDKRVVRMGGRLVDITALEFDLLMFLAATPGKPITREELMERVWGFEATEFGPTITTQISRLRAKLEPDPENPEYIVTVRGVGYRLGS